MYSRRFLKLGVVLLAALEAQPLHSQETRWQELNAQVEHLEKQGKYAEALPIAQDAARVAETVFGPEHLNVAISVNNLAEVLRKQGKYGEAEPLFQRALAIREKALGPEHPAVAESLSGLGNLDYDEGKYEDAEPLYQRALGIREKALGPEHPDVAQSLSDLASLYTEQGNYTKAEPLLQRSLAIREKALGPENADVAQSLNSLANLYNYQGKYVQAEPLYRRSLAIREKAFGGGHPLVASSLRNLGVLYENEGRYAEAEPLFQRALAIREKALGPEHPDVAMTLDSLARLYWEQGKYAQAEPLMRRVLAIQEKALGPEHPHVADSLSHLAMLYKEEGKYAEAEPLFQRALIISQKALGPEHPAVADTLDNLAGLYWYQGKSAQAEPLFRRALIIQEKTLGPESPDVALTLNNLAVLYHDLGKYAEAEAYQRRALAIRERALGPDHPDVAQSLSNLAILYEDEGKYAEAEPLYRRALAIREKALGPENPEVAVSMSNLAAGLTDEGKYAEAEPFYPRALAILERTLGPEHPDVEPTLAGFALFWYAQGLPAQAESLFARSLQNVSKQFEYNFTYMSENERLQFLDRVADIFPAFFSFCFTYRDSNPALIGKMYDVLLWQKGFVGTSIAALRSQIANSGDKQALALLDQLTTKKTQVSKLLTTEPSDRAEWRKQVEQLEHEANDLERELVKRSSSLAEEKRLVHVTWRDVQKALGPDEAAVEFVRFQLHDGKKWTHTNYYAALIVTPKSTIAPTFVLLGDAKDVEGAPLADFQERTILRGRPTAKGAPPRSAHAEATSRSRSRGEEAGFYKTLWRPLEASLGNTKRIYIAPDGVLNQISLGVVPMSNGQLLKEKYDIRLLSSTKDILREKRKPASNTAVLIGDPQFDLDETQQRAQVRGLVEPGESKTLLASASPLKGVAGGLRSRDKEGETLPPLRGTEVELKSVRSLLKKQGWQVESYTEAAALEETIKHVEHPRVLHVATHGFFLSDQERLRSEVSTGLPSGMEDPMLRSGLFFAGANRTLSGTPSPPDLEDGVLTAYEATGLNLQGTELVVLSACETGLGQVKNGEGVFGLRRALQEAGAEAVLMSLWSVPDRETQELMALFYKKWLSGEDKYEALREAQREERETVKRRYGEDLPYYWGAFVLVGR